MERLPETHVTGKDEREIKMVLVTRDENKALYERYIGGSFRCYEMFKIRKQEETTIRQAGVTYITKAKELFPNDEMFGKSAFSLTGVTKEQAIEKFNIFDVVTPKKRGRKPKSEVYGLNNNEGDEDGEE